MPRARRELRKPCLAHVHDRRVITALEVNVRLLADGALPTTFSP
jgi:hypothetical protein